jgi:hypothetical protein
MAEPTPLINAFLDAEFLAGVAVWNEPDDSRYRELQAEMLRYVSADLAAVLDPAGRSAADFDDFTGSKVDKKVARRRRRTLYATASWHHPKAGLILTAYVDDTDTQSDEQPEYRLHLALDRTPPQFIALETTCTTCGVSGKRGDAVCEDCAGVGWTGYRGNEALGRPISVQPRLHVPRSTLDEWGERALAELGL